MCTVTWTHRPSGYTLLFNRDEQRSREPASPPARLERDGLLAIAPRDGKAGGSWIGTHAGGLTVCLLNHYPGGILPPPGSRSRGLLLLDHLFHPDLKHLSRALDGSDLSRYSPFYLVAVTPGGPSCKWTWDGSHLARDTAAGKHQPHTTSGYRVQDVVARRTTAYRHRFEQRQTPDATALWAYHRSHEPEASARSVCMHREDACTVNFCRVDVSPDTVRFRYGADSPCHLDEDQLFCLEIPRSPSEDVAP